MKIEFYSIKIENFKNIDFLETNFGKKTTIYGANETGKTSFADAISWCLTGKNSLGDSQFDFVPIGKNDVSPSVTICIDISGKVKDSADFIILQRVYQAKQNRNKEFTGEYQTVCFVNKLKVGVREFDKWIETHICYSEIFRLIHDVKYFTENIAVNGRERPWEAQRRLLFSISGIKPDIEFARSKKKFTPIFEGLQRYDNANQYLAFLKSEEKRFNEEIRYNNSQIEMMKSMLSESDGEENLGEAIKRLTIEKTNIETEIEQKSKKLNQQRDRRIKETQDKLNEKTNEFKKSQEEFSRTLRGLNNKKQKLQDELVDIHCFLVSEKNALKRAKEDYDSIFVQCPTCGQYIPTEIIEEKKSELEKQIAILQDSVNSIERRKNDITKKSESFERAILSMKAPVYPEELKKLQEELINQDNNSDFEDLRGKLSEVDKRLAELNAKKDLELKSKKIKGNIGLLEEELKAKLDLKAENSRLIDLCRSFIDAKCKYAEKKVNDLFDGIEFKMFRQNKTNDEVKECCDMFWNGVPYDSLSYSTKFVVSMNIALAFQEYYKVSMPIVVDNSESIDFGIEIPVQAIMLVKRDECCPKCGATVGRKKVDGLWECDECENKFKKKLAIEFE